jgi:Retrotransposon gag protein
MQHEQRETPRDMEPMEQVDPKSYIRLAFKQLNKDRKPTKWSTRHKNDSSPSKSSSSSSDESSDSSQESTPSEDESSSSSGGSSSPSSGSSEDDSSETSDSESTERPHKRHRHRSRRDRSRGRKKRAKSSRRDKKRGRMTLKPIPPTKYDGSVDSKAFHRFITEGTAYVKDGRVPSERQAFFLSHFLTGRAHEFYVREVSGDPYRWRLPEFFRELFNYCFPVDYRIKLHQKLHVCYQNDKSVKDYLYELNEIWNMIGETNECTKVHKIWFGLWKEIQHDLWKDKLNPEISSLKHVVKAAKIIEIANSVTRKSSDRQQQKKSETTALRTATALPEGETHHHWSQRHSWRHRENGRQHEHHKNNTHSTQDKPNDPEGHNKPKKSSK